MKLIIASFLFYIALCPKIRAQISLDDFYDESPSMAVEPDHGEHTTVFNCSFETGACEFELVEPDGPSPSSDDSDSGEVLDLRWYRRQAVILSNSTILYDHTRSNADGTLLFATGGAAGSLTRVETALSSPPINCSAALCCFNAYALMRQSASAAAAAASSNDSTVSSGYLAFYIIQNSYGAEPISTILANLSFTSFGNFWTNVQRTFHANSHPFRIAIESRNGAGGREFYVAVDDITVTTGLCSSDEEVFGGHPGLCGAPPAVVAGEASISFGHTLGAGSQVSYNCLLGYDLIGPSTITCLLDGQWSAPPICSPFRPLPPVSKISLEQNIFAEERPVGSSSISSTDCAWGQSFSETSEFALAEPKLVLFPDNKISCSGTLLRWVFLSASVDDGTPVYLGVWRRDGQSRLRLIGLTQFTSKRTQRSVQFVLPAEQRFEVQAGDILGMIHSRYSRNSPVAVYDENSNLPTGKRLINAAMIDDIYIEDMNADQTMTVSLDGATSTRMLPLLQAYVGTTECPEQILEGTTFSGINAPVNPRGGSSDDACWQACREEPSCYAVTYEADTRSCKIFSYISTEVHFVENVRSMVKLCKADCDTKLLSASDSFDLAFDGDSLPLGPELTSADACELACRYTLSCVSFTYSNPFRPGTCVLFSRTSALNPVPNQRSYRKWGCANLDKLENCQDCLATFQCKNQARCMADAASGRSFCTAPNTNPSSCAAPQGLGAECQPPPEVDHATIVEGVDGGAGPAIYACVRGYEMLGNAEVPCLQGDWQTPLPVCRPACPDRPVVENGRVEIIPSTSNKQASITCNSGYRLVGQPVAYCLSPNTWTTLPQCVEDCGIPPGVGNARWTATQGTQAMPIAVRYDCNAGFRLSGSATLRCSNGVWSPGAPTCQIIPPPAQCPSAPSLTNGAIIDSGSDQQNSSIKFATYNCLSGYELIGQPTVYCRENSWDALPVCSPLCGPIPTVSNSQTKILASKNGQPTTVQYECLDGFQIDGDPIVSCISKLWSRPPRCINGSRPGYCGQPPGVVYGSWRAILQLGSFPLSVEYWCNNGFNLVGPVRLTCIRTSMSAAWQPAVVPLCQPQNEYPIVNRIPAPFFNPPNFQPPQRIQQPIIPSIQPQQRVMNMPPPNNVRIVPNAPAWQPELPAGPIAMGSGQPRLPSPVGTLPGRGAINVNPLSSMGGVGMPGVNLNNLPGSGVGIPAVGMPGVNRMPGGVGMAGVPVFDAASALPGGRGTSNFVDRVVSNGMSAAAGAMPGNAGMPGFARQPNMMPQSQSMSFGSQDAASLANVRPGQSFGYSSNFNAYGNAQPLGGTNFNFGSAAPQPSSSSAWQLTQGAPDLIPIADPIRDPQMAAETTFMSSSCEMIPVVANARYHILAGDAMSEVVRIRYVCYNGFMPTGPVEIECRGEGQWTPAPPLCKPDVDRLRHCGQPPSVPNSIIYPMPEMPGEPKIIQYDCNVGYRLVGNHTLYCIDGVWRSAAVDAEPPKCIALEKPPPTTTPLLLTSRPLAFIPIMQRGPSPPLPIQEVNIKTSPKRCKAPPTVREAHVWLLDGTIDNPIEIEYHCQRKGDVIKGDSRVRCVNGAWRKVDQTAPPPKCVPSQTSRPSSDSEEFAIEIFNDNLLPQQQHFNDESPGGEYSLCGPEPLVIHATSKRVAYNQVQYECMEPLLLVGAATINCSNDGFWSEPPYCIYVPRLTHPTVLPETTELPTSTTTRSTTTSVNNEYFVCTVRPPVVRNAVSSVTKGTRKQPQAIRFHCLAGYEAVGAVDVRCLRGGQWGPPPRCVKQSGERTTAVPIAEPQLFAEEYNPAMSLPRLASNNIFSKFGPKTGSKLLPTGLMQQPTSVLTFAQRPPPPVPVKVQQLQTTTTTTTAANEAYCWKMPHFLNGYFLAVPSPVLNGAVKSIRFVCKPGYVLFGPAIADCLPGEQWTAVPRCEPIPKPTKTMCKSVPFVEDAKFAVLEGSQANPTRVRYICQGNTRMFAHGGTAGILTCDPTTGNWSPEPPHCEPSTKKSSHENDFLEPDSLPGAHGSSLFLPPFPMSGVALTRRTLPPPPTTSTSTTTTTTTTTTIKPTTTITKTTTTSLPACPPLPTFAGGAYHYITGGASAAAVLVCSEGYSMPKGLMPIVRCNFGKWSPSPVPTCEQPGCSAPIPSIPNAVRNILDNFGGRVGARFQCLPGFQLVGDANVYCSNGAWTPLPQCRPALEGSLGSFSVGQPAGGNLLVPAGRMLQQTPSCGPLPQFPNGFFEMVQGAVGAMAAKFQCLPGFALVGSPIVSCGSNGRWPSNLPSCQVTANQCGAPPVVANSQIVENSFGQTHDGFYGNGHWVRYACIPGFRLVPGIVNNMDSLTMGRVTCSGSRWSPAPTCEHEVPAAETGCFAGPSLPISNEGPLLEPTSPEMAICPSAYFSCSGYVNHWEIGAMPSATGATVAFVSVWRRSDVSGAFRLVGANKVQPRPGIHMYEVQPSEQIRVEVGDFVGVYYADNAGRGVVPYRNDRSGASECVTSNFLASRVMSEISRRGFIFMTSSVQSRQYIIRAHIDNASPLCPELSPTASGDPSMSALVVSGFGLVPGSKRLVECKPGFRLEGPSVVTCEDGVWKPAVPACFPMSPIEIGMLPETLAGFGMAKKSAPMKSKLNARGKSATKQSSSASAKSPYNFPSEDDVSLETATDTSYLTTPSVMECGSPPKIPNGYAVRRSFDTTEYECDPGYVLIGQRQVSCTLDEDDVEGEPFWPTDALPRCTSVENMFASRAPDDEEEPGDECSAVPPTSLPHSDPLVVQSARSAEALLCPQLVVNCTGIVDKWIFLSDRDDNSSVILSVWRKVEDGRFVVVGANKFRVTHKGRVVKGVAPSEQFKAMRGDFIGVFYEEANQAPVVSLISPLGHRPHLEEGGPEFEDKFDCYAYQKFDADIRQAMRNPGFLPVPRNAKSKMNAPPAVGLLLKGPLTCEAPPPLINGRVHAPGDSSDATVEKEEAAVGQRVVYTCDAGYRFNASTSLSPNPVSGSITITCGENGRWKPTPPTRCLRNCPAPPVIKNAIAKSSFTEVAGPQLGDTVRYDCLGGFVNIGPPAIMCQQNFTWSDPLPECVKTCGEVPRVAHASVDYIDPDGGIERNTLKVGYSGDSFSYSCHNGYLMLGQNVVTCSEEGAWDPPTSPRCAVQCEPLPVIENARLLTPSDDVSLDSAMNMEDPAFMAGDRITVQCEVGYVSNLANSHFGDQDTATVSCGDDGRWSRPLPRCLASCGVFPQIENGRLQLTAEPTVLADPLVALSGHSAVIECAPGFSPRGGFDVITCHEDGTFGTLPVCEAKSVACRLDEIPYVPNSILLSDTDNGTQIGAHRHVSCLPGFMLEGESAIVCLASGKWSEPPRCELVDCGDPPVVMTAVASRVILNANASSQLTPQVAYQFSCQYGYELVGKAKVTCKSTDQSWTELPRCLDVGNPLCRLGTSVPNELALPPMTQMYGRGGEPVLADPISHFTSELSDLSICPSMRAVCTGEADRWIFYSQRDDGAVVVFGIWRPLSDDRYQLVGTTRWAANAIGRQIITLDESTAIRVQIGDILGVHYEQESDYPVVPTITDSDQTRNRNSPYPACYRLPLNDADVSMAMSSLNYLALSSAVSDPEKYMSLWQKPAVQLLIRPARGCTAPAPLAHGHHSFDSSMNDLEMNGMSRSPLHAPPGHVVTFTCDSGYQLAGTSQISCQSDGSWAPAAPLCVLETPNCRVGHDWALTPPPQNVPMPGRWMTMYPSMRFGCSAEIVEWKVYSIANSPTQVYLDVWRKVSGEWFELVGSNNFTLTHPGLVSLRVPTSSRIMVDHDCFIGVHYAEIEEEGPEKGSSQGAIGHWTSQTVEAANLTFDVELQDFASRRLAERDLRSEIVGYHYVSMLHSQKQQSARTPAIVALALTLPGCGVPKSIGWGTFQFDRSQTSLAALPIQPLSSLTTVGQKALYSCFEHFEMRGSSVATCTERGWTPAPMCIPKTLCTAGYEPPANPLFESSGSMLMIFTSMQFKCDGIVTTWRFYSLAAGQTVYLGVWRPVNASDENTSVTYRLVGSNTVRSSIANGVETVNIEQPLTIAVRRGDMVGIHYPSVSIAASQLVIPFADELEPRPWSRNDLFSGHVKAADHNDVMSNGGLVQFDEPERKHWRIPALQAVVTASFIDCGPVPLVNHATLVTGHGTRQSAVHRFACDDGYQMVGSATITCNSDGQWSTLPQCKPIGHCVWNSHASLLSSPKSKAKALSSTSDLQQEVSQMVIFTSIPIRCTGLVKEWRFLTRANVNDQQVSREPFIVHIDIWRIVESSNSHHQTMSANQPNAQSPSETNQQEFVLVGTNTISISVDDIGGVDDVDLQLTYRVPPESQLFAMVGDFVGWHYDGPASPITSAHSGQPPVILVSASDEAADQPAPNEAILAPVFHASLRAGDRHRFASAVRRRLPAPRIEALVDNAQMLPYGLCDGDTRCPANSDCLRRNCFAPACVCRDGFALNSNNTLCLPAVQLNQRCDASVACEAFNSRCSDRGVCECLSGWEPASDGRRCRPVSPTAGLAFALRGERCDATRQCYHRWYDQSCTEGVCRCRAGFRAATSIERRAFPHSATECRPVDYNLTSSDGWGDEAWSGDGAGGGGCTISGQPVASALSFDLFPAMKAVDLQKHKIGLSVALGCIGLVAVVGLALTTYYIIRRRRSRAWEIENEIMN